MKNLYKTLGTHKDASAMEVKKAYFAMAKKYHPDSGDEAEVKKFYEITEAYQILSNKEERRAYDLTMDEGKIVSPLIEEILHPKSSHEEMPDYKEHTFRQKEVLRFRRKIFWQAVLRVVGFSALAGFLGFVLSYILNGVWYGGVAAGLGVGLIWSLHNNFDLDSFIHSARKRLLFTALGLIILIGAISYFAMLLFTLLWG